MPCGVVHCNTWTLLTCVPPVLYPTSMCAVPFVCILQDRPTYYTHADRMVDEYMCPSMGEGDISHINLIALALITQCTNTLSVLLCIPKSTSKLLVCVQHNANLWKKHEIIQTDFLFALIKTLRAESQVDNGSKFTTIDTFKLLHREISSAGGLGGIMGIYAPAPHPFWGK